MKIAPCINCKNRELNCHSSCKEYKSYKSEVAEINKEKHREYEYKHYLAELIRGR